MRTTQTLAVGNIEIGTAVTALYPVVSEHAVPWLCLGAAQPILHHLTPAASLGYDNLTPSFVFRGGVEPLDCLGFRLNRSAIEQPHQRLERTHLLRA
jgi:hypothetical protein